MNRSFVLLLLALAIGRMPAAEVSGTIRDETGAPVAGATVRIYTAGLRAGDSPMCPSCWADCGKSATTDAGGGFAIKDVSDQLVFRLLVLAKNHAPAFVTKVDPRAGPAAGTVASRDLSKYPANQLITGQVVSADGKPVIGATVDPEFGGPGVDPLAITDESGRFALSSQTPIRDELLTIHAEGLAPARYGPVSGGAAPITVRLSDGVVVSGRVVQDGKPVPHVEVGLAQTNRNIDHWLGAESATTDANGFFHFDHAPANDTFVVYGAMDSLASLGAVPIQKVSTGKDGSSVALGDLAVVPAGTIRGRFREENGKPFAPGARACVSRSEAWDLTIVDVAPDGSFTARGVPMGETISVSAPRNYQIREVPPGLTNDGLNHEVSCTLVHPRTALTLGVVYKTEKDQWAEREADFFARQYAGFFKDENLSAAQQKLFLADKVAARRAAQDALRAGHNPIDAEHATGDAFEKTATADLGPKVYQDYLAYEGRSRGEMQISVIYHPPQDHWLTHAEREALARAWGLVLIREQQKFVDFHALSKADQIAENRHINDELETAGAKVLPPECQADFARSMAYLRKLSASQLSSE